MRLIGNSLIILLLPLLSWANQYEVYNSRIGLYNSNSGNYDEVVGKVDYLPNDKCYKVEDVQVDCMRFALLFDYKINNDSDLICVFLISLEVDNPLGGGKVFGTGDAISLEAAKHSHVMPFYIMKDSYDKGVDKYEFSCEMSGEEILREKIFVDFGRSDHVSPSN